jgi:NitT/TauT family transport system ATP-binding protein
MVFEGATGPVEAVAPLDLMIADHEFVCVVGPSGCGKTTLLRIAAGILEPTTGSVSASTDPGRRSRPDAAMVFQDHGLFPWMTVVDNVAFGLEARGVARRERRDAAGALAGQLGLGDFLDAYPHQLSGGMRQRVNIARAVLTDPQVLLMDEPFGALDAQTRHVLQDDLMATWAETQQEVLYVTHDIDEAIRLGDRVVVMSGRPARVVADIPIPFPRPRAFTRDEAAATRDLYWQIWGLLEPEARLTVDNPG